MRALAAALLLLPLPLAPAPAAAQGDAGVCDETEFPGPTVCTPGTPGRGVRLDDPLRVRYTSDYFVSGPGVGVDPNTLIEVFLCPPEVVEPGSADCSAEPGAVRLSGRVEVLGDEIVFLPDGGWSSERVVTGLAQGGLTRFPCTFLAGDDVDREAPRFRAGTLSLSSASVEPRCPEAPLGGFRIEAQLPAADDDGSGGSIEYLLFQTRGANIEQPTLRDRVRNFSTSGTISMAFILPPEQAAQPICALVAVTDGAGNLSFLNGGTEECVSPEQGNFFEALCSVRTPGRASGWAPVLLLALPLLLGVRRRRRSRSPR